MLANVIKIAWRGLRRHRAFSLINLSGLSIGVACCFLIFAFVGHELSFDGFHENAGRIYRIVSRRTAEGRTVDIPRISPPAGPALVHEFPEVVEAARVSPTVIRSFRYRDRSFFEDGVFYADKSIFRVFSFKMVKGDPQTALEAPYSMVLTEATARKYFGDRDPIGEVVNWDNSADYTVTGVVREPPARSHFRFNALASLETYFKYDPRLENRWTLWGYVTYLLLREGADARDLEARLPDFVNRHLGATLKEAGGSLEMSLQPLPQVHLDPAAGNPLGSVTDVRLIRAYGAVAVVILCIACFNFMNLTTARAAGRKREIGVRKVLGANRKTLIARFLGESFLFSGIATAGAVILARSALPAFNRLAGREISLTDMGPTWLFLGPLLILLFVGLFAGGYPALFLSAFRPVPALKGEHAGGRKSSFRAVLVAAQFTISIGLIFSTLVIFNQQKFMRTKDLGFDKHNLLVIALQNQEVRSRLESFKASLKSLAGVTGVCASSMVPGERYLFNTAAYPEGAGENQALRMDNFYVDPDFFDVFRIEILSGRAFSRERPSDVSEAMMINRTAAEQLGWKNPLGRRIRIPADPMGDEQDTVPRTVIGVFRDIHQRSLYSSIPPTLVEHCRDQGPIEFRARRLSVRLQSGDLPAVLAAIEQRWKEMFPGFPYHAFFLDEFYDGLHRAEPRLGRIFAAFAGLAVGIGCLGLLGLAAYSSERRTKEIGIRKVLGASTGDVIFRLSREFLRPIALAFLIGWPAAFAAMSGWLRNFPYAVKIRPEIFVETGFLILIAALSTVGYQAVRAAGRDPATALRHE